MVVPAVRRPPIRPAYRRSRRVGLLSLGIVLAVVIAAGGLLWRLLPSGTSSPTCETQPQSFSLSSEQAAAGATISAVGLRDGLSDHAVTIALATSLQETQLANLPYGDRDSVGLFQQRPSQGWGTRAQLLDPVYAAHAFYQRLRAVPGWQTDSVTAAAQAVQRSNAPSAYADWEPEARALARAFTGEVAAGLSCRHLRLAGTAGSIAPMAAAELGTTAISGRHDARGGWIRASWLVAHASQLHVSEVRFAGQKWTGKSGRWAASGPVVDTLSYVLAR